MLRHPRPGRGPLRELGWGFGGEAGLGEKGHIQGEAWGLRAGRKARKGVLRWYCWIRSCNG